VIGGVEPPLPAMRAIVAEGFCVGVVCHDFASLPSQGRSATKSERMTPDADFPHLESD
jgi:hypothetical protein